ncbi:three-Cys-motif partner protein TcmP [Akkermansia massiliensis]
MDNNDSFNWKNGYPVLEKHSQKKLDLLHGYLVSYLTILLKNIRGKQEQEVTFIDGFAGGGLYKGGELGSPFVFFNAVKEANAIINQERKSSLTIKPTYYFIEKNKDHYNLLKENLAKYGYTGFEIKIRNSSFSQSVDEIISDINRRHPRGGNRTIFFLDQCGYSQVPATLIKSIHNRLYRRAEFIINFSSTWLADFFSEKNKLPFEKSLQSIGIEPYVNIDEFLALCKTTKDWRYPVEARIATAYHYATGIKYFSPFYIMPENNHRGYLLIHLADSSRARYAMVGEHWKEQNGSRHFGNCGLDIFAYRPQADADLYEEGLLFTEKNKDLCQITLHDDLGKYIRDHHQDGIQLSKLLDDVANTTIADHDMILKSLRVLKTEKVISCPPYSRSSFRLNDTIIPSLQTYFSFK